MNKHYVIGDIHGEYKTLLKLIDKLPKDAKLIFVGDLVDRGLQSREVVAYIREQGYSTVMGNHEVMMIRYGERFALHLLADVEVDMNNTWIRNGGIETLLSYGLLEKAEDGSYQIIKDAKAIEQLKDDIEWMKKLPIYLELDTHHSSGQKVVVSHSNISKVWMIRNDKEKQKELISEALWTRDKETSDEVEIFNIYGHTPQKNAAEITDNFVNIDTGCCYYSLESEEYGRLSAYCVESGEVFEVLNLASAVIE
ncbi:MAG: serine/threonine protein phosphatase [Epsilonproteobacteria bacterium]|nr:serine/threonine protein phosphatase [Campylobacterota bacterium]